MQEAEGARCNGITSQYTEIASLYSGYKWKNGSGKEVSGSLEKALMHYAKDLEEDLKHADSDRVFITHSGVEQELVQQLIGYLESFDRFKEIHVTTAGGVISSHCGPGTLGILFYES